MSHPSKITVFLAVLLVAACVTPQPPAPMVKVPDKLKPGANESLATVVFAKGVQIYECRAKKDQVGGYNGRSWLPKQISSTRREIASAVTMPAPIGNRPMAARSWVR